VHAGYDSLVAAGSSAGWSNWLRQQLDERGWKPADLIRRSGGTVTSSQTTRWLKDGQEPNFESVRSVCAALSVPAVQGLLAAEMLSAEDVGATVILQPRRLEEMHHDVLLGELARRLDDAASVPSREDLPEVSAETDATPPRRESFHPNERPLEVIEEPSAQRLHGWPEHAEGERWAARRRRPDTP
jgi:hypothetical protein